MAERPILFSAPMVRAILAGQKTQTRRVMKPQPSDYAPGPNVWPPKRDQAYFDAYCSKPKTPANPRGMGDGWCWWTPDDWQGPDWIKCPAGMPGDRLWVRETLRRSEVGPWVYRADDEPIEMAATDPRVKDMVAWAHHKQGATCVSIHMPRWASRILLELVDVRVQRLHDITETDAEAEGIREPSLGDLDVVSPDFVGKLARSAAPPLILWEFLWKRVNGDASWAANPWVWVYDFKRVQP